MLSEKHLFQKLQTRPPLVLLPRETDERGEFQEELFTAKVGANMHSMHSVQGIQLVYRLITVSVAGPDLRTGDGYFDRF